MKHEHFNSISDTSNGYTLTISRLSLSSEAIEISIKKDKTLVFTLTISSRRFLQLLAEEQITDRTYSLYCYSGEKNYLFNYRSYDEDFKLKHELYFRFPKIKIPELF